MTTGVLPAGPVRAVIIDLDGTMVDTAGDFHAAINQSTGIHLNGGTAAARATAGDGERPARDSS